MIIERAQIMTMIPHAGTMCLLDQLLGWDQNSVRCLSRRYAWKDNPMRRADGTLGMATGIELAAQAMAVHGRLSAATAGAPARGFLVSLREVRLSAGPLDATPGDLLIDAARLVGDAAGATYQFALTRDGVELISGRAMVVLSA
jgi:predicted hotdog family 3-hydroxylacyl-ACP dehydratase